MLQIYTNTNILTKTDNINVRVTENYTQKNLRLQRVVCMYTFYVIRTCFEGKCTITNLKHIKTASFECTEIRAIIKFCQDLGKTPPHT